MKWLIGVVLLAIGLTGCSGLQVPSPEGFQDGLIAGGVSEAEYRLAIDAAKGCIEAGGWRTSTIRLAMDGNRLEFGVEGPGGSGKDPDTIKADSEIVMAVYNDCYEMYLDKVEYEYLSSKVLTGDAQQVEMRKLAECLEGVGVEGVLLSDDKVQVTKRIADQLGRTEAMVPGLHCLEQHSYAFPF